MKKPMKSIRPPLVFATIFFVAALAGCAPTLPQEPPPSNQTFIVESSPDTVGLSQFYVIRHKVTGERFLYVQRNGSAISVVPMAKNP